MEYRLGETVKRLRKRRGVSQEDLAAALGFSMQAVSKWETGKAHPDLFLLPKLAEYFAVEVGAFFYGVQETEFPADTECLLEKNCSGWTGVLDSPWKGVTALPSYGPFTPTEDELCLLGDLRGKAVLEIACGTGESLVWMARRGAGELWGLDISAGWPGGCWGSRAGRRTCSSPLWSGTRGFLPGISTWCIPSMAWGGLSIWTRRSR